MDKKSEALDFERYGQDYPAQKLLDIITPENWLRFSNSYIRRKELELIEKFLNIFTSALFLYVGTGIGGLLPQIKKKGLKKIGIDINHSFLKEASNCCKVAQADAAYLPFKDESVDIVFFDLTLHHIVGQGTLERVIHESYRVLRPSGLFLAFEPGSYFPSIMALNFFNKFKLMGYISNSSNYEFGISPFKFPRLLRKCFREVDYCGISFCWRRMPIFLQKFLIKFEPAVLKVKFIQLFCWQLLYSANKPAK